MVLDLIHKQNNWTIKRQQVALLTGQTIRPLHSETHAMREFLNYIGIINKFEYTFKSQIENANSHHEDFLSFAGKFCSLR